MEEDPLGKKPLITVERHNMMVVFRLPQTAQVLLRQETYLL